MVFMGSWSLVSEKGGHEPSRGSVVVWATWVNAALLQHREMLTASLAKLGVFGTGHNAASAALVTRYVVHAFEHVFEALWIVVSILGCPHGHCAIDDLAFTFASEANAVLGALSCHRSVPLYCVVSHTVVRVSSIPATHAGVISSGSDGFGGDSRSGSGS